MKKTNILIIGTGFHARRIYIPAMFRFAKKTGFKLILGVDLVNQRETVEKYLIEKKFELPMKYIEPFEGENLPPELDNELSSFVKKNKVEGVIISTEPLFHKCYAMWALRNGLNVLMDKPITAHKNVTWNQERINLIGKDYDDIFSAYQNIQNTKKTIFTVNTQRRYHLGFQKVFDLIRETADQFNAPVTSIQSTHEDGQWFLPEEISTRVCHPLNQGYGKCFHSGYHLTDIINMFYNSGKIEEKFADSAEVFSSFIQPRGFLKQFNEQDYQNYFGNASYSKYSKKTHEEYFKEFKNYGELDAFSIIRLIKNKVAVGNISLNLLHNSFSRRSWLEQSQDLYKGNGRVKHEYHNIQQGPFQCIQIHSYQTNDKHELNTIDDYNLGGNNHFDIYVFRNAEMFGNSVKSMETFSLKDLDAHQGFEDNRLFHESSKDCVILEFIKFIKGDISIDEVKSNITTNDISVKILASLYQSNLNRVSGLNPIATFKYK